MQNTNGVITMSRITFFGYAQHLTILSRMLNTACCLIDGLGLQLGLDIVTGWLMVKHTYLYYFLLSLSLSSSTHTME